ncbi:MAG: MBOAT family O-acyltransferase, partial [Cyclobacteriaceae bacterium]
DNCAKYANQIFDNSADYGGATLVLGAFFFTIQIYADFSGYSDIAIGTSRLFGFHLSQNFAAPYFSRNFAEVWRKWHISLSTWFRDYLFIPLVKSSKPNVYTKIRNIFILFITIGFWHGANWKFVVWGALQALLFLPSIFKKNKVKYSKVVAYERPLPSLEESFKMARTFSLIVFTMIFFRATNIEHAISFCQSLFAGLFHYEEYFKLYDYTQDIQKSFTLVLIGFIVIEWLGRRSLYSFEKIGLTWSVPQRFLMYYGIAFCILWFSGEDQQYIYFEF